MGDLKLRNEFAGYHTLHIGNIRTVTGKDGSLMSVDYFGKFEGKKSNVHYLPNKAKSLNSLLGYKNTDGDGVTAMRHERLIELMELNQFTPEQIESIKSTSVSYFYRDTALSIAYLEFFTVLQEREIEKEMKEKLREELKQELYAEILLDALI